MMSTKHEESKIIIDNRKNKNDILEEEEFDPTIFFTKKELCYYKMIDKFFKKCPEDKIIKMLNIIEGQSEISLRILDWFVTKYAKRGIDFTKNGETFDVHINYKAQLKSYKKRYFDPFRRKKKFNYKYTINREDKILYTTIGQLNFFRWAISNDIINFVEKYLPQITKAMNISNKEDKKKKNKKIEDDNLSQYTDNSESDESKSTDSSKNNSIQKPKKTIKDSRVETKSSVTKKRGINVNAIKNIKDDEIELILCFD